jgi:restriction endonuclease Mrr
MAAILDVLADECEHIDDEIQERVATYLQLTAEERAVLLKNRIPKYKNQTAWALVCLQDAKCIGDSSRPYIEKTAVRNGHEVYRITDFGIQAQRKRLLHDY